MKGRLDSRDSNTCSCVTGCKITSPRLVSASACRVVRLLYVNGGGVVRKLDLSGGRGPFIYTRHGGRWAYCALCLSEGPHAGVSAGIMHDTDGVQV